MSAGALRGLELELEVVENYPVLVLRTELLSFARTACTLKCSAISLAPKLTVFTNKDEKVLLPQPRDLTPLEGF